MKLLIDMNLSPRWVSLLNNATVHAVHWSTVGAVDAPDTQLMTYAAEHNYVVLTHDLDFGAILAATHGGKPSVVQIRSKDLSPDVIGNQVIVVLRQMKAELEAGALVTIDSSNMRMRLLPLLSQKVKEKQWLT